MRSSYWVKVLVPLALASLAACGPVVLPSATTERETAVSTSTLVPATATPVPPTATPVPGRYAVRRTGADGLGSAGGDWTDELWRTDSAQHEVKLFAARGLEFRVAPGERAIAVTYGDGHRVLEFLDRNGKSLRKFGAADLCTQCASPAPVTAPRITLEGWTDSGDAFWGGVVTGPMELSTFYRIEPDGWKVSLYDVSELSAFRDYALNPNTGKLAYSNWSNSLAYPPPPSDDSARKTTVLRVYDLLGKTTRSLVVATGWRFEPSWLDDRTIEYNDPEGEGRVSVVVDCAPGYFAVLVSPSRCVVVLPPSVQGPAAQGASQLAHSSAPSMGVG